ncbi:MAG TPA: RNA ligase partner protein [Acidobacteriaceae bacterium]|nr:RNA ligase partner protein [Acidobacteriaceae bacterium]
MTDNPRERIVLDTSVFTNPSVAAVFGDCATRALAKFTDLARQAGPCVEFYMPPSVLEELRHFTEAEQLPRDLELVIKLRAPRRHDIHVPGMFLYELIEDIRQRIDRGLRVAERAVREVQPASVDKTIRWLRDRYRDALRTGLLDSSEDLDVILLAVELDAAVASADRGLLQWAEKGGLRLIPPERLRGILEHLIEDRAAGE